MSRFLQTCYGNICSVSLNMVLTCRPFVVSTGFVSSVIFDPVAEARWPQPTMGIGLSLYVELLVDLGVRQHGAAELLWLQLLPRCALAALARYLSCLASLAKSAKDPCQWCSCCFLGLSCAITSAPASFTTKEFPQTRSLA